MLRQAVDMLQRQLQLAEEREELKAKNDQIESLQRLLGASKPTQQAEKIEDSISEPIQPPPHPLNLISCT